MSEDAPKSAYELAMEKLRRQDREEGRDEPEPLSEDQKEEIARIRSEFEAKIAQNDIMHRDRLHKAADPDEARTIEEKRVSDRLKLEEARDAKISAVRRAG